MKKTFSLLHPKKNPERVADKIKFEIKKYIKRESNKERPTDVDFWDFDCRFGVSEEKAIVIHVSKINEHISKMVSDNAEEFYLEILSKPGIRGKKPEGESSVPGE